MVAIFAIRVSQNLIRSRTDSVRISKMGESLGGVLHELKIQRDIKTVRKKKMGEIRKAGHGWFLSDEEKKLRLEIGELDRIIERLEIKVNK